jgi:hypothetical protein
MASLVIHLRVNFYEDFRIFSGQFMRIRGILQQVLQKNFPEIESQRIFFLIALLNNSRDSQSGQLIIKRHESFLQENRCVILEIKATYTICKQ